MTKFRPAVALALALAVAMPLAPALASPHDRHGRHDRDVRHIEDDRAVAAARVDAAAAIAAVRTAGYGPVRKIEWDHGRWEVKTTDTQGYRVTVYVDATSGTLIPRNR